MIKDGIPELKNDSSLLEIVWRDLYRLYLQGSEERMVLKGIKNMTSLTTPLGKEFIKFISG